MPTLVSTWEQFTAALVSSDESTAVIEVMADLDVNDNPPRAKITCGRNKTINGNGHTIWNLSTASVINDSIISLTPRDVVINELNFYNMNRIENYSFLGGSSQHRGTFNDCKFQGQGSKYPSDYGTFSRCTLSWKGIRAAAVGQNLNFNNSWIHTEITRASASTNYEFNTLTSCYVEGTISTTVENDNVLFCSSISDSVVNVETSLAGRINNNTPVAVNVFNTTKAPNFIAKSGTETVTVGVTDSQLKNAEYLYSVGFNIITG